MNYIPLLYTSANTSDPSLTSQCQKGLEMWQRAVPIRSSVLLTPQHGPDLLYLWPWEWNKPQQAESSSVLTYMKKVFSPDWGRPPPQIMIIHRLQANPRNSSVCRQIFKNLKSSFSATGLTDAAFSKRYEGKEIQSEGQFDMFEALPHVLSRNVRLRWKILRLQTHYTATGEGTAQRRAKVFLIKANWIRSDKCTVQLFNQFDQLHNSSVTCIHMRIRSLTTHTHTHTHTHEHTHIYFCSTNTCLWSPQSPRWGNVGGRRIPQPFSSSLLPLTAFLIFSDVRSLSFCIVCVMQRSSAELPRLETCVTSGFFTLPRWVCSWMTQLLY